MNDLVRVLKALSDRTRAAILTQLSNEDLCVGALADRLNVTHSAVSQHLRILREVGLVAGDKRGYWVHYSLNRERVRELSGEFSDWLQGLASASQVACASQGCASLRRRATGARGRGRSR